MANERRHAAWQTERIVALRAWVLTAWDNRLSRSCLIVCGASLWLSVGFVDPRFLLPIFVFGPVVWWRQRNEDPSAPAPDTEDWL